jgi:hypothetical protein
MRGQAAFLSTIISNTRRRLSAIALGATIGDRRRLAHLARRGPPCPATIRDALGETGRRQKPRRDGEKHRNVLNLSSPCRDQSSDGDDHHYRRR